MMKYNPSKMKYNPSKIKYYPEKSNWVYRWERLIPGERLIKFGIIYCAEILRAYTKKRIKPTYAKSGIKRRQICSMRIAKW